MIITNEVGQVFEVTQKIVSENPEATKQLLTGVAALILGIGGAKWRPIITAIARVFGVQSSAESTRRMDDIEARLAKLEKVDKV